MRRLNGKGFTLIELLIVVAIIGILAAIAVPNFMNARVRAKVSRCFADMKSLWVAMESYYMDNNAHIPDYDSGAVPHEARPPSEMKSYAHLSTPIAYLSSIPLDPFFLDSGSRVEHALATGRTGNSIPQFQYAGPEYRRTSGIKEVWQPSNTLWTITSLGPDKTEQAGWSFPVDQARAISYSPSNGVISTGDIYSSNHGILE